jgi:hypothetical protein
MGVMGSQPNKCKARISRSDVELDCALLPGHETYFHWDDRGIAWYETDDLPSVMTGDHDGMA